MAGEHVLGTFHKVLSKKNVRSTSQVVSSYNLSWLPASARKDVIMLRMFYAYRLYEFRPSFLLKQNCFVLSSFRC